MKIIAEAGHDKYICEVSRGEVERYINLYYGKMKRLEVGDEIDLARGHDFAQETRDAMEKTQKFIEANAKIVEAILNGLRYANMEVQSRHHEGDPCVHCDTPHDEVESGPCPGPTKKMKRK